jgi:hypothetical protein
MSVRIKLVLLAVGVLVVGFGVDDSQAVRTGVSGAGQADARLEGRWSITLRDVEVRNLIDNRLLTVHRRWRFEPVCDEGACDVTLVRRLRNPSGIARLPLSRSEARYSGAETLPGNAVCRSRVIQHGYAYRTSIVLRVVRSSDDGETADRIRGHVTTRGRPRRAACRGGPRTYQRSVLRGSRAF